MPTIDQIPPASPRVREKAPSAQPEPSGTEATLSEDAISAIQEGRADHAAGRAFTLTQIKQELGHALHLDRNLDGSRIDAETGFGPAVCGPAAARPGRSR